MKKGKKIGSCINVDEVLRAAQSELPGVDMLCDVLSMEIIFVTKEGAAVHELTPKEMIGKHAWEVTKFEKDSEEFINSIMEALSGQANVPVLRMKSGEVVIIPMDFVNIDVERRPFLATRIARSAEKVGK